MSGVHAKCVEKWIRTHRRAHADAEVPKCSVCKQPYSGQEQLPGAKAYAAYMLQTACQMIQRFACPLILCYAFYGCAQGGHYRLPKSMSITLEVILFFVSAHRLTVITVSWPPGCPAPQSRLWKRFFVNSRKWGKSLIFLWVLVAMLVMLWVIGDVSSWTLILLAVISTQLMVKCSLAVFVPYDDNDTLCSRLLRCVSIWITMPCILRRHSEQALRKSLHPFSAGIHILMVVVTVLLCASEMSTILVLAVWALHSGLLTASLVEALTIRRLRWRKGRRWLFVSWDALVAAVYANECRVMGQVQRYPVPAEAVSRVLEVWSFVWVAALASFSLVLNWQSCVRHYMTWQRRHRVFRVRTNAADNDFHYVRLSG